MVEGDTTQNSAAISMETLQSKTTRVDVVTDVGHLSEEHSEKSNEIGTGTPNARDLSEDNQAEYTKGFTLVIVVVALLLSMFLVALDMTIVATAVPQITREFHSVADIGWYASAFFVTLAIFQSFWGKCYKYFRLKWVFTLTVFIFELGSLICGLSPNSISLIIGRSITGLGGAGIVGGVYIIMAYIVPPASVPKYLGLVGAVFSIASVAGPLVGGAFTTKVTWRWCFYVNLPIGGSALGIILFLFRTPKSVKPIEITTPELFKQMDLPGTITSLASLICYVLALEYGGVTKLWSSSIVIGLLVGWITLSIIFVAIQIMSGDHALLVLSVVRKRTVASCCAFIFCLNAANFLLIYNLPIYFQAIDNTSAAGSGVRNLPLILGSSFMSFLSGHIIARVGYYQILLFAGSACMTIGAGLVYTLDVGSSAGEYIGYQLLVGLGIGTAIQVPVITVQAFSTTEDIPIATTIILFFQLVSGAFGVSAAQSIFTNRLIFSLPKNAPGIDPAAVVAAGSTAIQTRFPPQSVHGILMSYMQGLKAAWAMSVALAGLTFCLTFLMPWKSIKSKEKESTTAPAG